MGMIDSTTSWIEANEHWLTEDHAPMTESLVVLAETAESERSATGRVSASVMAAYRMAFRTLMEMAPAKVEKQPEDEDDLLRPMSAA